MDKKLLRDQMKNLRNTLSADEVKETGLLFRAKLTETNVFKRADNVFVYLPIRNEADTLPVTELCFSCKKRVLAPKTEDSVINFYEIKSLSECRKGTFGIQEPVSGDIFIPKKEDNNIIIVPGLAFDENFNRLGYGGGYYDKFFEANSFVKFIKVGLAYEFQVLKTIPHEKHDMKMDYILTPSRLLSRAQLHP